MPDTEPQHAVIDFLRRPGILGPGTPELVETHASIVFLSGDRAFKLKRAVRYSYLDYGTPDKRRAACEAELFINRRFAPDLYREVLAIHRAPDGTLRLDGEGEAVDWLLVMRRFAADAQLDHLAARQGLSSALLDMLADRIVEAHEQAPTRPAQGGHAGIARARAITVDNLRPEAGHGFAAEMVEAWIAQSCAALRDHAALLEQRRHAGKVRACHGDLHLRNICVLDGVPTLFDAIEFDPDLASTDILYDLAFLLMDLADRGLHSEGNQIFNRYLDRTRDDGGLAALPLFLSLRAAIRAQVTAATARRTGQDALLQDARAYLSLALDLLRPREPRLVAIGGLSGTGKSRLAARLAPRLAPPPGARLLRSDMLRKRMARCPPEQPLPATAYTPEARAAIYAALADTARLCLEAGSTVVADAAFLGAEERAAMEATARQAGRRFEGLWLEAPPDVLVERVAARRGDASDATPAVVRAQLAAAIRPPPGWRVFDSGGDADALAEAALAWLARDAG
ncbi:bifunctional aminoglycoside phosphotransferase/ATP-binding protein [Teichococcus oryzae]|uniref:AAA family ATPase n=1 Tax=Teichococcus oryzae TaxID=1608942 RepID=A0A5B2THK9_9PROT|nr:bifunctional aminoglycoside phosphotransferase/ATP-binding protein [Pseudoroseomonas oryzae]KAA2213428.1 AAA family ATPase [Pseudoroseomonas oryzae]